MNELVKDAGGKASDVVAAMIGGLKNPPPKFKIHMEFFGRTNGTVCYGCAATCAVMQISGKVFTPENFYIRAKTTGYSFDDYLDFEIAVDSFRRGELSGLENLIGTALPEPKIFLPELQTATWKSELWAYEAYRDQLREANL
jgi:hypothetical protein